MKTALLFPGQGSQFVGMGKDLAAAHPAARETFAQADAILDHPLSRICWEGPEAELRSTQNTQPAIFVHSMAVYRVLGLRPGVDFTAAAGHSLGEYSAYVAAGSLSFEDALRLVRRRGELMFRAGQERPGTMAAVLGLDEAVLLDLLGTIQGTVVAANLNSPGQVVLSGDIPAVEAAMEACRQAGAKRVIPLEVSGAFHSPLMGTAAAGLREALARVEIRMPQVPVTTNVSASPLADVEAIRESLAEQLTSAVRWEETIRNLRASGVDRFLELGPGKVLSGLARSIDRGAPSTAIGGPDEIAAFAAQSGASA
jgi:[acyl-carrier-protein] S-malonyltransferase